MKMIKKFVDTIQEDIIGTGNRVIAISWAVCLLGVVGLGFYMSSESMSFLGVADSREVQVNFEYPVEIKKIHVLPGQVVRKGELLLELNQSELDARIRVTRSQIGKLESELRMRQHLNSIVSNASQVDESDPLLVDISDLRQELEYLEKQKKNLYIFADVAGIVGGVNFKKGEKVPSFTSVVTLSPKNPSYVEGFVHENLKTKLEIGKKVSVIPVSSGGAAIEGKIVSVGSRIILIPQRLMHYPNMQVWGREVVVEIPSHNNLLLGEKVQIKPKLEIFGLPTAIAADTKTSKKDSSLDSATSEPQKIQIPDEVSSRFKFEPSGAIYLEDLKKYLVVSDDTDKADSASLFLVDQEGKVDDQVLLVPGVGKISDLESISQSGEYIYLLTSQGLTKKGNDKEERNLFVRTKRTGLDFSGTQKVNFKLNLIRALSKSSNPELRKIEATLAKGSFEIEGHFVEGNDAYFAFKIPFFDNSKNLVLKISDIDSLFGKQKIEPKNVSLWSYVDFGSVPGAPHRFSDLIRVQGDLYATTVCSDEKCGAVWKLREQDGKVIPEMLKSFAGLKPEGIAYDSSDSTLFVTFDQKQKSPMFTRLSLKIDTVKKAANEK